MVDEIPKCHSTWVLNVSMNDLHTSDKKVTIKTQNLLVVIHIYVE